MNPRVLFTKDSAPGLWPESLPLFREALQRLFPNAVPCDGPDEALRSPHSFFLREGEALLWIEWCPTPFSRNRISDYLARVHRIESATSPPLTGILVAPDFDAGVEELLRLIQMPLRLFRCQEAVSLGPSVRAIPERVLWLQEMTPPRTETLLPSHPPTPSRDRLSREELREFIQLELDLARSGFA